MFTASVVRYLSMDYMAIYPKKYITFLSNTIFGKYVAGIAEGLLAPFKLFYVLIKYFQANDGTLTLKSTTSASFKILTYSFIHLFVNL
jgi:hypothetical protein